MLVELNSAVLLPLIEENFSEDNLKLNELENTVMPKIWEAEWMAFIHIRTAHIPSSGCRKLI